MKRKEFLHMLIELVSERIICVKNQDVADFILFCKNRSVFPSGGLIDAEDGSQFFYV